MILEQDKQAILNGAYGISRKGLKCKFVGLINGSHSYVYMFVYFNAAGFIINTENLNENFNNSTAFETPEDVVGLWKDKPEPFDLERALASEPVMTRDGSKAYIVGQYWQPEGLEAYCLIGYGFNGDAREFMHWHDDGKVMADDITCDDIIGMWKEQAPVPSVVTLTLPRPLKEPQDGMWYINECGPFESHYHGKDMNLTIFNQQVYFNSKEDAQAWFKAMQDSRR